MLFSLSEVFSSVGVLYFKQEFHEVSELQCQFKLSEKDVYFNCIFYKPKKHFCIYLFGVLRRFQHCAGHITMDSFMGRGNQYIQLVKVLYCKLPTNGKQLLAFPLEVGPGFKLWSYRWEVSM